MQLIFCLSARNDQICEWQGVVVFAVAVGCKFDNNLIPFSRWFIPDRSILLVEFFFYFKKRKMFNSLDYYRL